MRAAILGDIHGNYRAFRSCVEDALSLGAECFVLLGDFVTDFPYPERTMDMMHSLRKRYPCYAVRGNRERYLLEHREGKTAFVPGSKTGSLRYTYERLREEDLDYFAGLPIYDRIAIQGVPMEIAHAERDWGSGASQIGRGPSGDSLPGTDCFPSAETRQGRAGQIHPGGHAFSGSGAFCVRVSGKDSGGSFRGMPSGGADCGFRGAD